MTATEPHGFTVDMLKEARRALEGRRSSLIGRQPRSETFSEELAELDAALARLDDGTWGRCERCDGAIGRVRLRALPETRWCLPCSRQKP
jgi:hypothetical protein